MHHCLKRLAAAIALGLPLWVTAQGRTDPAESKAPTRVLAHRSAFADYKPFQDLAPGDWRRLNDVVGRAALKSGSMATEPSSPPAAPTASAPAASLPMAPMPGHHRHPHGHPQGAQR